MHSGQYREKYGNNLQKQLPRIPRMRCLSDFIAFRDSGLALAKLHLFYERLPLYQAVQLDCAVPLTIAPQGIDGGCDRLFEVEKMKFGGSAKGGRDKSVVVYNRHITISQIPLAAYDYLITGKSPPEWAMDRQKVSIDKASGIKNDANDYARDTLHNPRYPLELFLRLITLSLNTQAIVGRLPDIGGARMSALPERCCLHCAHADFRLSAKKGWYGWAVCARDDVCGSYRSPKAVCSTGRFRLADNVTQRSAWWARTQKKGRDAP